MRVGLGVTVFARGVLQGAHRPGVVAREQHRAALGLAEHQGLQQPVREAVARAVDGGVGADVVAEHAPEPHRRVVDGVQEPGR